METNVFHSDTHGKIRWIDQLYPKSETVEVTIYFLANEAKWKYFRRDPHTGEVDNKEVDWNGYLLGGRSFHIDMNQKPEWFNYTRAAKEALIEREIDDYYSGDDLFCYHVEPVDVDKNYAHWNDKELWELERLFHNRIGKIELELRDLRREYAAIWRVGDNKYDWADRL